MRKPSRLNEVKNLYEKNYANGDISRLLNLPGSAICYYLDLIYGKDRPKKTRYGYKNKKYSIDERYFEFIDREDKAYFLGLIYADGCLVSKGYTVQISLKEKDKYILEKMNECMKHTKPLREIKESKNKINQLVTNSGKGYLNQINSYYIRQHLENQGCTPKKSLTLNFPNNIPENMVHHFIRGYFDGNGCVYRNKKNTSCEISITSSWNFNYKLQDTFKELNLNTGLFKLKDGKVSTLRLSGALNLLDFYNYLYKDSTIYLLRKKEIFDDIVKNIKSIRVNDTWKKKNPSNS